MTGNQIATYFASKGKSKGYAADALKALVAEGFVLSSAPGVRGAIHLSTGSGLFTAATDPKAETPAGKGFGGGGNPFADDGRPF